MKNSSNLRNANILAGIFFILLAFWQFIDRLELGFLDLEWLVSIYSESLITAVVCFIMAIFCFIGKKNIYLVVVTGCATLGIFVANYSGIEFLAFDTFLCLPILILFATEIFS